MNKRAAASDRRDDGDTLVTSPAQGAAPAGRHAEDGPDPGKTPAVTDVAAPAHAPAADAALDPAPRKARARVQAHAQALVPAATEKTRSAPNAAAPPTARETTDRARKPELPAAFQQPAPFEDLGESPTARRRRRFLLALSAVFGILLPGLLAIAYYGFIATDQFITEVRFLVKSGGPVTPDLLGQLTGTGSSISTFLDAQTVSDYLHSRQVIEDLEPAIDLREVFGRPWADPIARLPADASIEDLTEYWESMVEVTTEMMSGIVTVSVRTFSREDSARLGQAILDASERLVNQLSARARADTVRFATEDLQAAEDRLRYWRSRVYQLREKEQTLDAAGTAEAHTQLIGELEAELAKARSELQYRQSLMDDRAPLLASLRSKIASLSDEIERIRRQATSGGRGAAAASGAEAAGTASGRGRDALTAVLSGFEEAQAELAISEEYYKSALRYLEESRAEADRQQVYVATIVAPHTAEDSRYPLRIQFIILAVVVSGIVWGLVMLMVYSIRDHVM